MEAGELPAPQLDRSYFIGAIFSVGTIAFTEKSNSSIRLELKEYLNIKKMAMFKTVEYIYIMV